MRLVDLPCTERKCAPSRRETGRSWVSAEQQMFNVFLRVGGPTTDFRVSEDRQQTESAKPLFHDPIYTTTQNIHMQEAPAVFGATR